MKQSFLTICTISLALFSCKKDSGPAPIASFSVNATNLKAPSKVSFTNASSNAISYSWQFGDGSTSFEQSPSHVYELPGTYTVKLKAIGGQGAGISNTSRTITIEDKPLAATITYVKLTTLPQRNWDGDGSSADVFFKITNGSTVLNNYAENRFVNPASLPVQWNFPTPYIISPLQTERRFELWDYDSIVSSELIGIVNFNPSLLQINTTTPYPDKFTLTSQGLTVELGLQWQ